jgi:Flp pilus assembly protein TadD
MTSIKNLNKTEQVVEFLFFLLFPLFFLPVLPNMFATAKLILLATVVGVLLLIKAAKVVVSRKLTLHRSGFDNAIFLFAISYLLSVLVVSPNKVEALLDPSRGAAMIVLFSLLVFLVPKNKQNILVASTISLLIMFVLTALSYFSALSFLPQSLAFINTRGFNLVGNLMGQIFYSLFFIALVLDSIKEKVKEEQKDKTAFLLNTVFIFSLLTAVFSVFIMVKDVKPTFMPLSHAWQISVDVLKIGKNALFGVGPANYVSLFTNSKPLGINAIEQLWNVNIEISRSTLLHVMSEVGLVGLLGFGLLFLNLFFASKRLKTGLTFAVMALWTLLFPPSQMFFFVLFLAVLLFREQRKVREFDLTDLDLFAYATGAFTVIIVAVSSFFFFKTVKAEYLISASYKALEKNQPQQMYDMQRLAIVENPYNERARISFSQTNMLLANNLSQKKKLTEEDKQTITTLVYQSINEAKALVSLNPQKATYWANLAEVYRTLLGKVQDAEEWTISPYQKAISLDPKNPTYYFNLGSVYYGLGNFKEASTLFEQAISLKQNVANYYYNLAWVSAQQKDFVKAVNVMEMAMQLIADKKGPDYKKASKDLKEFRKQLPQEETEASKQQDSESTPQELTMPTPVPTGGELIELPDEAAPDITVTPTPEKE